MAPEVADARKKMYPEVDPNDPSTKPKKKPGPLEDLVNVVGSTIYAIDISLNRSETIDQ